MTPQGIPPRDLPGDPRGAPCGTLGDPLGGAGTPHGDAPGNTLGDTLGDGLGGCVLVFFRTRFGGHIKMRSGGALWPLPPQIISGGACGSPQHDFGLPNHLEMTFKIAPKTDHQTVPQTCPGCPQGCPLILPP